MESNALITVIGRQDYCDGDKDKIEMSTIGSFDEDNENYIISYTEEIENSLVPVKTQISITKNESRIEMIKSGAISSCLIIERSKRNLCEYGTEYGSMLMGIYGKNIKNVFDTDESTFDFSYEIDINGALSSQNDVTIKVKHKNSNTGE